MAVGVGVLVAVFIRVGVGVIVGVFVMVGVLVGHAGCVMWTDRPTRTLPPVLHSYWVNWEPVPRCTPTVALLPFSGVTVP